MTQFIPFVPLTTAAFSFQATMDGSVYNFVVTWNLYGQRYYLNCYTVYGDFVANVALSGSPNGISLQAISWLLGTVTATCTSNHGYPIGAIVNLTVSGCSPSGFNGTFPVTIINRMQFSYDVAANPGPATSFGAVAYNVNLLPGYFSTSTIVYRALNATFEVSP